MNNDLKSIIDKLSKFTGIDLEFYSEKFLERRLSIRLKNTNTNSYKEYIDYVESHQTEAKELKDEISINVTNFFRDYSMWQSFIRDVIPEIEKRKSGSIDNTIKIWSAGCSSGEEITSILISLLEHIKDRDKVKIKLLGSDFNQLILNKAMDGKYEDLQFREMPAEYKFKYFSEIESGLYELKQKYKNMLSFEKRNLLHEKAPDKFDIIFCRNVVIYFSLDAKKELYTKYLNALKDQGYLIIGKTEILQGEAKDNFKVLNTQERIYQKQ